MSLNVEQTVVSITNNLHPEAKDATASWITAVPILTSFMDNQGFPFEEVLDKLNEYLIFNEQDVNKPEAEPIRDFHTKLNILASKRFNIEAAQNLYADLKNHSSVQEWALWLITQQSRRQVYDDRHVAAILLALTEFMETPEVAAHPTLVDYLIRCKETLSKEDNSFPELTKRQKAEITSLSGG